MKRTTIAAALCLALAATAHGQDADAETRFHRAYEQEVVEGKLADAARVYLAMMDDAKVPERLRAESKFRFAVTAVLLGRSDEGRVHLSELVRDPKTPESLRARAAEYLDVAKGIGVGSEIDKKLQSLVFDLAKDAAAEPAAYRDFEVIGKRAVPFLRQMLVHDDQALRAHAFRILLRMQEPGMGEAWTPELTSNRPYSQQAFTGYLAKRPDERAAFERKLLALPDDALAPVLQSSSLRAPLTAATLRVLAARRVVPAKALLDWFPGRPDDEALGLREQWIRGDDAPLSAEATLSYLNDVSPARQVARLEPAPELFPAVLARLSEMPLGWTPSSWSSTQWNEPGRAAGEGFIRLAAALPQETLLDALAATIDRASTAPESDDRANPIWSGLVDALAIAVERRDPEANLPPRYGELLKRWFTERLRRGGDVFPPYAARARAAISRVPRDAAESLSAWMLTFPWPRANGKQAGWTIPTVLPRDVPIALAALKLAGTEARATITSNLGLTNSAASHDMQPEYARALSAGLADVVRLWSATTPQEPPPIWKFAAYAQTLPVDEARSLFAKVAEALSVHPEQKIRDDAWGTYLLALRPSEPQTAYWRDVALPVLELVWEKLGKSDRQAVTGGVLSLLGRTPADSGLRESIVRFVSARYGDVPVGALPRLAQSPDLFPLTDWVPLASADNNFAVPAERADPAVREMTKDPAAVRPIVLSFTQKFASPAVQTEVFDRLLRTAPLEKLSVVFAYSKAASTDALEDALRRVMEAREPDLGVIAKLVPRIRESRPSERLFPAIRLLLARGSAEQLTAGIDAAKGLGREELLPDLAKLLDSMDEKVRTEAKAAIDSIVELRKLKEEARRRSEGK